MQSGDFELLDEWKSSKALVVRIFSFATHKMVWNSKPGAWEDDFSIHGQGKYHLCFSNGFVSHPTDQTSGQNDQLERTVGFAIRVQPLKKYDLNKEKPGPLTERASQLLEASEGMQHQLNVLLDHIEYMKTRERNHESLTTQIQNRILNWTIVHSTALVIMAFIQVIIWRRHFENL